MAERRPQLIRLLRNAIAAELAGVHTSIPGRVLSYDTEAQSVEVDIGVRFSRRDPDTGERVLYDPPPLPNVPVLWPAGGGGDFSDTCPINKGDEVWLLFAERSIDEWVISGDGTVVTPADGRRFNLSDAVAMPVRSSSTLPAEAVAEGARVIRGPEIRLGSAGADDFVALASLVRAEIDALWNAMENHVHPAGVLLDSTEAPVTGATGTTTTSGSAGNVGAGKVKAE